MKYKYVLFGGSGFLGQNLQKFIHNKSLEAICLGSKQINLLDSNNSSKIKEYTSYENTIYIFFSALTPDKGKDINTFEKNIKMAKNFVENFDYTNLQSKKIIYISSDAVYPLNEENISLDTKPSPTDLYSSMHLTREIMFKEKFKKNLFILRPTLIYGYGDTHNSYGPNRFFTQMINEKKINIFGDGLDIRDHLYIDDFCKLVFSFSLSDKFGSFYLASGNSISYKELAEIFMKKFKNNLFEINKIEVDNHPTKRYFDINFLNNYFKFFPSDLDKNIDNYFKQINN